MTPALTINREDVAELADVFEDRPAEELIEWAADRFGGRIVLTCSWQKQSSILVHMVSELAPDLRIVELDTGLLFAESYATRDRLIERYGLQVESIVPALSIDDQAAAHGAKLWKRDPDACCAMRKVAPLERALVDMDAWVTGIRREQSPTRAQARKLQWDERRAVVKVQPLVDWSDKRCWDYIFRNRIPYNPLHDTGYPSLGCTPCTRAVTEGENERAGRWSASGKLECGLHA